MFTIPYVSITAVNKIYLIVDDNHYYYYKLFLRNVGVSPIEKQTIVNKWMNKRGLRPVVIQYTIISSTHKILR